MPCKPVSKKALRPTSEVAKARPTQAPHLKLLEEKEQQQQKQTPIQKVEAIPVERLSLECSIILEDAQQRMSATRPGTSGFQALQAVRSSLPDEDWGGVVSLALRLLRERDLLHLRKKYQESESGQARLPNEDEFLLSETVSLDSYVEEMVEALIERMVVETRVPLTELRIHGEDSKKNVYSYIGFIGLYHGDIQNAKTAWKESRIAKSSGGDGILSSISFVQPNAEKRVPHKIKKQIAYTFLQFLAFFKGDRQATDKAWGLALPEKRIHKGSACTYAEFLESAKGDKFQAAEQWIKAKRLPTDVWVQPQPIVTSRLNSSSDSCDSRNELSLGEEASLQDEKRIPHTSKGRAGYTYAEFLKWAKGDAEFALEHWEKATRLATDDAHAKAGLQVVLQEEKRIPHKSKGQKGYTYAEFLSWAKGDAEKAVEHWEKAARPATDDAHGKVGPQFAPQEERKIPQKSEGQKGYTYAEFLGSAKGDAKKDLEHWGKAKQRLATDDADAKAGPQVCPQEERRIPRESKGQKGYMHAEFLEWAKGCADKALENWYKTKQPDLDVCPSRRHDARPSSGCQVAVPNCISKKRSRSRSTPSPATMRARIANRRCEQHEAIDVDDSDDEGNVILAVVDPYQVDLPCPWRICIDECSGKPFYFNDITEERQWEPPEPSE